MPLPGQPPIPPQLAGPPGPTGGVTTPQPMLGQGAGAMADIRNALVGMQKALPGIPMGSELHSAVLKAVADISKHLDPTDKESNKGIDLQALVQQARASAQNSPGNSLARAMGPPQQPQPPNLGAPPPQLAA